MAQVDKMLREMAGAHSVQVVDRWGTTGKLARLVLVAEQFGFMYGETYQTGGRAPKTVVTLHRDPSPEAQSRAAETARRFPQAGMPGGDLPGMQPGGKLQPLPEAQGHLELLKARIGYDLTGKNAEKRVMVGALGLTAGCVFLTLRNVAQDRGVAGVLVGYALLLAVVGGGFLWNRRRNARFANVLQQAGLTPVQDASGRTRYVPPGSALPEQQPFGQFPGGGPAGPGPAAYPGQGNPMQTPQQGFYGQPPQQPYGQPGQQASPAQGPYAQPGQPAAPGQPPYGQPGQQVPPVQQPQPGYGAQPGGQGPYSPPQHPQPPYPPQQGAGS